MSLSKELKELHESGDVGRAVEDLVGMAEQLEATIEYLSAKLHKAEISLACSGFIDNGEQLWKPPVNTRAADLTFKLIECTNTLKDIAEWDSHTFEFSIDYGSSGVRDLYRDMARDCLKSVGGLE